MVWIPKIAEVWKVQSVQQGGIPLPLTTWSKCRDFWTKIFIFILTKTAIFEEWFDCDIISCKFSSEGYLILMNDDAVISTILMTHHISTCHCMWTNRIISIGHLEIYNVFISTLSIARNWLSAFESHLLESNVLTCLNTVYVQAADETIIFSIT